MNMDPFYNEKFLKIYLPVIDNLGNISQRYALKEILHFNSLNNSNFLFFLENKQIQYSFVPLKEIKNANSNFFLDNINTLIDKKIPFIEIVEGHIWQINENIIKKISKL